MNFQWGKELQRGQDAIGYLMQYSAMVRGIPARAMIQSYPQLPKADFARIVHVTLFLESEKSAITDGLFHWIYDDILEIVRSHENEIFPKPSLPLEYIETQTLLVKKMPDMEVYGSGDYAFLPKSNDEE